MLARSRHFTKHSALQSWRVISRAQSLPTEESVKGSRSHSSSVVDKCTAKIKLFCTESTEAALKGAHSLWHCTHGRYPCPSCPYCGLPALQSLPSQSHMVNSAPHATEVQPLIFPTFPGAVRSSADAMSRLQFLSLPAIKSAVCMVTLLPTLHASGELLCEHHRKDATMTSCKVVRW